MPFQKGDVPWNKGKKCPQLGEAKKGKHPSEEVRKKMSEARKGKPNPHKGHSPTEETREKISEALKGKLHPVKCHHISEEERQRVRLMGLARKGTHSSKETRAKLSKAHIGKRSGEKNNMWKGGKWLLRKVDEIFSLYIRLKGSKDGMNQCITCGRWLPIKELDCGHYISRQNHSTRFDERNVAPQCRSCNRFHEGVKDEFALALVKKYGDGILEELNQKKHMVKKYTQSELKELYEHYKKEVEKLLEKLEVKE